MMSTEEWKRVEELFHAALQIDPADRKQFLQEQCDDPLVLQEVTSLLAAHQDAGSFIASPITSAILDLIPEQPDESLPPGQVVGVYEILYEIGKGGMGAVYLAARADKAFEKHVAIKLLKRGMDTAEVLRHFRNERQILAAFDHPNIARLLDGGTSPAGVPYFVMEYVQGVPIDEYCDSQRLTITERLEIFRQVCAAVSYAHRHLVIHRDIKPSNILVTPEGVPKLLDFGIAKILHPDWQAGSTATGWRLMTPEYASPEQVMGLAVTTVSDVYALGVLLYELLAGRPPYQFENRSPIEIARVIHQTQPPLPSASLDPSEKTNAARNTSADQLKRRLRGDLDNIVSMALRKEPQRRYQSVEQFSEDIRRHLAGRPVLARKDTIVYRVTKFAQRNKIGVTAAVLLILTLLAGVIATTWQARKAKAEQARAEYANEFGDELRYIESLLLSTYSAPVHDTRPTIKLVRDRLRQMEQRMLQGGVSAYGSGNHALGNAYLMLKDYDSAKKYLEKAWNSGHREPSTAYALGKTLGGLYLQAVTNADQLSNRNMKVQVIREADAQFAQPAIRFLSEARAYAESPAYVEGLILLYQKRFEEALEKAKEALKSSSRPYEVMKLEGDVHFERARQAATKGLVEEAIRSYAIAGEAYERAVDTARSDQDIYLADARRLTRMMPMMQNDDDLTELAQKALLLCDQAIKINPDNDQPYLYKSDAYFQQGINQMYYTAIDPRPAFQKAIGTTKEALKRKPGAAAYGRASASYLRIGEYQTAVNADPRDALNRAVAESQKALQADPHYAEAYINRAAAYFYISEYQLVHGEDPRASLTKVIDTYEKDLRSIKKDDFGINLLALAYLGFGEYKLQHGMDPRPDLDQTITHLRYGLQMNPKAIQFHDTVALAYVDLAKYDIDHGIVPEKNFDLAISHYDQAIQAHGGGYTLFNRGIACVSRAAYKIRVRQNPLEDLDRAMHDFQKALKVSDLAPALQQMASVHLLRARHQFVSGKNPTPELAEASRIMNRYLKENPVNPDAYLTQGMIQSLSGRWAMKNRQPYDHLFDNAIEQIEKCIELNQYEINAYLELASIYRWRKLVERGIEKTVEAEKFYPQHPEALAIRAKLLQLKNQTREADDLLQQAIKSNQFLKAEYGSD